MNNSQKKERAGIILCGGHSRRMGQDKASLLFNGKAMLAIIAETLAPAVDHLVIVRANNQTLPELPKLSLPLSIVEDLSPDCGPVEGLRTGLASLPKEIETVFVSGCDTPLLCTKTVEQLFNISDNQLNSESIIIPTDGEKLQPLAAVYPREFQSSLEIEINSGNFRLMSVIEKNKLRQVSVAELRSVDPNLGLLHHVNTPEQLAAALLRTKQ